MRILLVIILNIIYFALWYIMLKLRNSNGKLRDWDNGNEFYESLPASQQDSYWKEDTQIVNDFFYDFFTFFRMYIGATCV